MATIALYAGKLNQMPGLIKDAKKSVDKLKTELSDLQKKASNIDVSVCDLSEVISSIQASAQTQENRIAELENFQTNSEEFINEVIRIDNYVADTVNQNKENFYKQYDYLKPECEKSGWEKFCDKLEAIGEWCQKHWKLIVTAVIVVVSVVLICTGVGAILSGIAMGALMGAGIGGLSGGLESLANGGSFWEGFEDGAFSGAISGAVMGGAMAGLGQLGAALGHGIKCASALGKTIKVTAAVTKTISTVMGGFDTLAMMDKTFGIFGGNLADFNAQLHESALYNTFQIGVTALAVFTNGMTSTMSCFVAGTLVLTACGLVAIENIKAGDKVISTNPDTGVTEEKTVLEAFRRTVTELVHLTIGGEVITTTHEHPFYVAGKGFVNAGKLRTCDILLDSKQNKLTIDDISFETSEEPTTVYNFKVEEYHTYYVCKKYIFVHNADCAQIIQDVESGEIELKTAKEKGNYGEMKMDQELRDQGYTRISTNTVESLDSPIHQGIDGIYYNKDGTPQYIIGEAKYGTARLGKTSDGPQMGRGWIQGRNRLPDALGGLDSPEYQSLLSEIFTNPGNVGANVYHVNPGGAVDVIPLNPFGV